MPFHDWTSPRTARLGYTYEQFARAKLFVFGKWRERAAEIGRAHV